MERRIRYAITWTAFALIGVLVSAFLVIKPVADCLRSGGLPVASIGYVGCAQPFVK